MSASPPDEELEQALRGVPEPAPSPTFVRHLREAFVAGRIAPESASRGRDADRTSDVVSEPLEEMLLGTPVAEPARASYRSELRRRFVAGELSEPAPAAVETRPTRGRLLRLLVPLAAAAAILAVTFMPRDSGWEVTIEGGPIEVAGMLLGSADADRIAVELGHGARIDSGDSTVRLVLADALEVELRPGTRMRVAALPDHARLVPARLELETGEAFLRKLGGPTTGDLRIRTPEAEVLVLGTVLGVLADERGTCVCVSEGRVSVAAVDGRSKEVGERESYLVFGEAGLPTMLAPFGEHDEHVSALVGFSRGD